MQNAKIKYHRSIYISKVLGNIYTMINMGNDRHITNVVLVVHNSPKLISCKLHLHRQINPV